MTIFSLLYVGFLFVVAVHAHNVVYSLLLSGFDVIVILLPRLCQRHVGTL